VVEVVGGGEFVFVNLAAFLAFLDYSPLASGFFGINWLHESATVVGPIPREVVYMFAPKAMRTMIGVSVPVHPLPAILTSKIFHCFFECF
jgi:hypothetical protein